MLNFLIIHMKLISSIEKVINFFNVFDPVFSSWANFFFRNRKLMVSTNSVFFLTKSVFTCVHYSTNL